MLLRSDKFLRNRTRMNTLMAVADKTYQSYLQSSLTFLIIGGFVAAVILGSIAWYSSKRPAGWENTQTPDWISKMNITDGKKDSSNN
jgi:hypothetical protein